MTNNKAEIIKLEFGGLLNFAIKSHLREVLLFQGVIEESMYQRAFNKKLLIDIDIKIIGLIYNKQQKHVGK